MKDLLKVSIITAVLNNIETIKDCLRSIHSQSYRNIEHIIVDGGSTDGTIEVIERHGNNVNKWISESDNGIYDALNKGIAMSTGDIIGFLHSDDLYADSRVIEEVVDIMSANDCDSCYGDLEYVSRNNTDKVIRFWRSSPFKEGSIQKGWMPPHPTLFVRKEIYDRYGGFNTDFRIAADYELILRFIEKHRISACYIPAVLIRMRLGGVSNRNLINMLMKSSEDYRALKQNNITHAIRTVFLKNISKLHQFFHG